jgi:broad specificity phosphatase PhoE
MSGKVNNEGIVRKSISIKLIRHAESMNNEVYRNARIIYKGGTPEFDQEGWDEYVEERRKADPGLSSRGEQQAQRLAQYLSCHLSNQASSPARVITSPMRRTIETILPTLHALNSTIDGGENGEKIQLMINALYHETEGCYAKGRTGKW